MDHVTKSSGFVSRDLLERFFSKLSSLRPENIKTTSIRGVQVSYPGDYPVGETSRSAKFGPEEVEIYHYLFVGLPRISAPTTTFVVEARPSESKYLYCVTVSGAKETSAVSAFLSVFNS